MGAKVAGENYAGGVTIYNDEINEADFLHVIVNEDGDVIMLQGKDTIVVSGSMLQKAVAYARKKGAR